MNDSLDLTPEAFEELLAQSAKLVSRQHSKLDDLPGYQYYPQAEVERWFDEPLPENGMSLEALLTEVQEKVLSKATGNLGPHMYAYVMAGGNQVGIVAEQLAATINQNVAKWHLAPSITEIDKRVIQWIGQAIGFSENAAGFISASGSSSNLDGLTVARNLVFEAEGIRQKGMQGLPVFTVYASTETHNSVDKAVQLLGIGSDNLRKIATNDALEIDLLALEAKIEEDLQAGIRPFCIVGNAGTVNTGAIDDLNALADLAERYNMWLHVDGAYGGLVAMLDSKRALYRGIDRAQTVALDFHKWLYQPFEVGCLLVKDWAQLRRTYFQGASYLDKSLEGDTGRIDMNEHHFLLSRQARSLKVWMSIKAYGMARIKAMIQKDIDLAAYLSELVQAAPDFELVETSPLAISCFRYTGSLKDREAIVELNRRLIPALERDGRVFITGTQLHGAFTLRACIINHRKTKATTRYLLEVIREVGLGLLP